MANRRLISILFADLVGSSKITRDEVKRKLHRYLNKDIIEQLLNEENNFYYNTWGDGLIVCSDSPIELAEIALQIKDKIMHKDWHRFGLSEPMRVRIGLHCQTVEIITDANGKVSDVVGIGVDKAARIEPVTEPNQVFCSEVFQQLLINDNVQNIIGIRAGRRTLVKNYGEMELFRLAWSTESSQETENTSTSTSSVPMPKIKKKPSDKDYADFLSHAFEVIQSYFKTALGQLSKSQLGVEVSFRLITTTKLVCELYLDGLVKNRCKIWIGGHHFGANSINYVEGRFSPDDDSSTHEILQINNSDSELYLSALFSITAGSNSHKMTPEQAAEHLWLRLIKALELQ